MYAFDDNYTNYLMPHLNQVVNSFYTGNSSQNHNPLGTFPLILVEVVDGSCMEPFSLLELLPSCARVVNLIIH